MTTWAIAMTVAAALTALGGLALCFWSVFGDQLATRRGRRTGEIRRCPSCWYDMAEVGGLLCPECGHEAKDERRLFRARRRRRWAGVSAFVLLVASALGAWPHGQGGAWKTWLPDVVVIELIPYTTDDPWAAEEMMRRLMPGRAAAAYSPEGSGRLADRRWRRLAIVCAEVLAQDPERLRPESQLLFDSPYPGLGVDVLLGWASGDNRDDLTMGTVYLSRRRAALETDDLERAVDSLREASRSSVHWKDHDQPFLDQIVAHLERRTTEPDLRERAAAPVTCPQDVIDFLHRESASEVLYFLESRGWSAKMIADVDETAPDPIEIERIDLHLDDDESLDCVLLISNRLWERDPGTRVHYDSLIFLHEPAGWRLAARLPQLNRLAVPPAFTSAAGPGGRRWFRVRADAGWNPDGSWIVMRDEWYRVTGDGLELAQSVHSSGTKRSELVVRLDGTFRSIERRDGKFSLVYNMRNSVAFAKAESETVFERDGEFVYPLGVAPGAMGVHAGVGPWEGQAASWIQFAGASEFYPEFGGLLVQRALTDPALQESLLTEFDEQEKWLGPTREFEPLREELRRGAGG